MSKTRKIFISYRKGLDLEPATALRDSLTARLKDIAVELDSDETTPASNWAHEISQVGADGAVMLVLVSEAWVEHRDAMDIRAIQRFDDPQRAELRLAAASGLTTIPVVLDTSDPLPIGRLPEDIWPIFMTPAVRFVPPELERGADELSERLRTLFAPAPRRLSVKATAAAALAALLVGAGISAAALSTMSGGAGSADVSALRAKAATAIADSKDNKNALADSEAALSAARAELANLRVVLARTESERRNASRTASEARKTAETALQQSDAAQETTKQALARLKTDREKLLQELAAAQANAAASDAKAQAAERRAQNAGERAAEAAKRAEFAEQRVAKAAQRIDAAEQKATNAAQQTAKASQSASDAEKKIEATDQRLTLMKQRAAAAQERAETAEKRAAAADQQVQKAEQRAVEMKRQVKIAEGRAAAAEARIKTAEAAASASAQIAESAKAKAEQAVSAQAVAEAALKREITVRKAAQRAAEEARNRSATQATDVIKTATSAAPGPRDDELKAALEKVSEAREAATVANKKAADAALALDSSRAELKAAQRKLKDIEITVATLRSEVATLKEAATKAGDIATASISTPETPEDPAEKAAKTVDENAENSAASEKTTKKSVAPASAPPPTPRPTRRTAQGKPLRSFRDCNGCPTMVAVPSGAFQMGSPQSEGGRTAAEGPRRRVRVASFALGRFEVTTRQWTACVTAGYCRAANTSGLRSSDPIVGVSWRDITGNGVKERGFIAWMNSQTAGSPYRLPSEAEWEYAERAGATTRFAHGSSIAKLDDFAWHRPNSRGRVQRIGARKPNAWGFFDMQGNVKELVRDCWHTNYLNAPRTGRPWLSAYSGDCARAVVRGGAWNDPPAAMRSSARGWSARGQRSADTGFRIARDLN